MWISFTLNSVKHTFEGVTFSSIPIRADNFSLRNSPHRTKMLVLFETPAGYAIFKSVCDKAQLSAVDDIAEHFNTAEGAQGM
jgi:hypothetical protein